MNDARLQSLLRMIAHDLKGLLGTPGLLIHLVETAATDEERAERLIALKESFHALDRTVTDLGDLGHALGETAPASNLQPTDLRSLVEAVVAQARPAAALRRIAPAVTLAPDTWPAVQADATALQSAFERILYWGLAHAASGAPFEIRGTAADGTAVLTLPGSKVARPAASGVRERIEEIVDGARELGVALPLARETLERHGGSLTVRPDGAIEVRLPLS